MGNFLRLVNGQPRSFAESGGGSVVIYDAATDIGATVTAGTNVSLPSGQTYTSAELEVYLNGIRLEPVVDYNYVGSAPRTQVTFTFDLAAGDRLRFRTDRAP